MEHNLWNEQEGSGGSTCDSYSSGTGSKFGQDTEYSEISVLPHSLSSWVSGRHLETAE